MKLDNVIAERKHKKIYRDGNLVAKVFDESFPKSDVLNEALNQARVEETGLNIPKIEEVTKIDGKWAIISDYIEGKTLKELMDENPDKIDEYMNLYATTRYELHTRLASMKKHSKVCHGDFNPSNVIITPEGVPYVLDWSHATQGNGAADAARTYLLFMLNGQKDLAEKYIKLYCFKSDTARQYINNWMPIVAASQSVKGNPEERELLLSWANVFDYQ